MTGSIVPVEGKSAWLGSKLDYRAEGLHVLSGAEVVEIDDALAQLGAVDFADITPSNFPLPALGRYLSGLSRELRDGRGFVLLRGLPRERYSPDQLARIYFGLGAHIGSPIPQSWHGELLGHVMNISDLEPQPRGYHAGGGQKMHTDSCDIVALMCVRAAKSGGASRICSAAAVHNRMLETRPDLLEVLYGPYVYRRMELDAKYGTGEAVKRIAVFARDGDAFSCNVKGNYPIYAEAAGDWVMTEKHHAALDELHRLAGSPEFYLDMSIGEGDIQFLNNRVLLHGRTDFEDWEGVARRRHMMRLWLEMPSWRPFPASQWIHTKEDHAGWLHQRTALMEVPSRYLAEMQKREAALAN